MNPKRPSLRPPDLSRTASHPVTSSQCKYQHEAATAAAAPAPGVYIRCCTRLSFPPSFLLLFTPPPACIRPLSHHPPARSPEQQLQRCELTGADPPAHQLPQHAGGVEGARLVSSGFAVHILSVPAREERGVRLIIPPCFSSFPSLPPSMCSSRCQRQGRRKREKEKGGVAQGTNPGAGSGGGAKDAQ